MADLSNRRDHGESPLNFKAAGFPDPKERRSMATKEHLDQMGISVAPNGSIIVRYINGDGQRVTLDLTAIIEEKVEAGIAAHDQKRHGHQL
jgi:hypothetical protein